MRVRLIDHNMRYLNEKDGPIWYFRIYNFNDLRDLLENEIDSIRDYVFRGQARAEWELVSTLNRLINRARRTGAKQSSIERFVQMHINRFKLEIRGRRGDNPPKLNEDELWALGQHYGLATPLLDWSKSPYISLFFALEGINEYCEKRALWCLNTKEVEEKNKNLSKREKLYLIFPDTDDNKRLLGQSGLFSKGPVMKSVNAWVMEKFNDSNNPILLKIEIPGDHNFRKETLKTLELMNITHSTIFPDLIGASRFCNIVAEDYET